MKSTLRLSLLLALIIAPADASQHQPTTATAAVNGMSIAYERYGEPKADTVLLICGTGMQMTEWPQELIQGLVDRGFSVIRFDNRDAGLSSHLTQLGLPDWAKISAAGAASVTPPLPYSLNDMARDAVDLLSALGIRKAHIIGASQGGVIAQIIGIHYPDRVLSLVSIMSGSGNPAHPPIAHPERLADVGQPPAGSDTTALIAYQIRLYRALQGRAFPESEASLRIRAEAAIRRSNDPAGVQRQQAAALVAAFQDRRKALSDLRVPVIVVQGDDDPLIPLASAREVAASIPGAEFILIPGMGHDLPPAVMPQIVDAVAAVRARPR